VPDLVSRVGSGIRRGFTVARVKSREAVDVQRVKSQIRKLERERNAALGAGRVFGLDGVIERWGPVRHLRPLRYALG